MTYKRPQVVMMGYVDAQYHVQRKDRKYFVHLEGKGLFVYLDDFFLYAASMSAFYAILREVLSILFHLGLRCKGDKCELSVAEIAVLGHIVNADGIHMGADRKAAVDAVPFPRSCKELRRFLGMANYMRRFIPGYAVLAKPLFSQVNLLPAKWPLDVMRPAFAAMKDAIQSQLHLAHLDYAKAIVLRADASVLGGGVELSNRWTEDGETITRVVAVASHAFTAAESRWKTIEQECFILVFAVMHFRAVLLGQPFLLETDHRNLTYIHGGTDGRWRSKIFASR